MHDPLDDTLPFSGERVRSVPPDAFPGYRLLEEIHRGGQGVVYKALQESTQRFVAIKLLRDTELAEAADLARFQQEVRILGRLRHANIVRIYDSGVVGGRIHYVMDYISGLPYDAFLREARKRLARADILRLFVKICDAVNAAHVRGIIHRDLKPGNIRVDDDDEPCVLDFGLSKLSADRSCDVTLSGQFVGSPVWAAPEQAAGRPDAIDVRTDVYSLGMLLYNTLTDAFPYRVDGGLADVLAQVTQADPTPPRAHDRELPTDLETIVLKCLQKDPERRYQSAGELSRDLGRFLRGEPIDARRDSVLYLLARSLARYRAAVIASALVLVATLGGLCASLAFWRDAEAARSLAVDQGRIAARRAAEASESAARAERESVAANAVADFLTQVITAVDPYQGGAYDMRVADTLDGAVRQLDAGALRERLDLEGRVRRVLAQAYASLGLYHAAHAQIQTAIERFAQAGQPDSPRAIQAEVDGVSIERRLSLLAAAEPNARTVLAHARWVMGEEHPLTLSAMNELASLLYERGPSDEAESLWRRALDLDCARSADRDSIAPRILNNLGQSLMKRGRLDEARDCLERNVEIVGRTRGPEHPAYATGLINLAILDEAQGRLSHAQSRYEQALERLRSLHGDNHPDVAKALGNLADLYRVQNHFAESERLAREALAIAERFFGPDHGELGRIIHTLAATLYSVDRYDEAAALGRRARDIFIAAHGPEHDTVLAAHGLLAAIDRARGNLAAAERSLRAIHTARNMRLGPDDPRTLAALNNLGTVLAESGRFDQAEAALRSALERRRAVLGDSDAATVQSALTLAYCLVSQGRAAEAEELARDAVQRLRPAGKSVLLATACNRLGWIALELGRLDEAVELCHEALEVGEATLPGDDVELARLRADLGRALARLGRAPEALEALRSAFETLHAKLGDGHDMVLELREEIADACEALGDAAQAARWRAAGEPGAPGRD